jgi:hypothetical protein
MAIYRLIAAGMVVSRVGGVTGVDDLIRLLNGECIGRRIAIDVLRRGQLRRFEVIPLERPAMQPTSQRK